ncbi:heme exporter protein CcmD [Sphingomonas gilva]|uniref:Heme exporter protein D n=1 Tax=Sphingomonas gilva TaxID=2305907 RepID=A0A396RL64_9SPHN|nr:heme exporter protein CcmD [Sphingomonas gilva]RHW17057.1 heme exporter protein CcmD [Sphingomonas gilva]
MNHWPFILAAYGVVAAAMALLIGASWRAMRRAERAVEDLRR